MYIRLVIIFRFLWIFTECNAMNVYPMVKPARLDYFLSYPFLLGGENALVQNMIAKLEKDSLQTAGDMIRGQVLAGHSLPLLYGNDDEEMTEPPQNLDEEDTGIKTRGFKGLNDAFASALAKLPAALQAIVKYYREKFQEEMKQMLQVTKKEEPKEKVDAQLACNTLKEDCLAIEGFGVRCMMDCLTKGNPMVNKYSGHIARILRTLCEPIGTDFATLTETMEKDSQGSPVETFLRSVKSSSNPQQIVPAAKMGADSLLFLMVTGVATSMLPFGVISTELKGLLSNQPEPPQKEIKNSSGTPGEVMKLRNPMCNAKLLVDETFQMSQVFERDQGLLDVILPGFNIISTMVKYVPGDHQAFYSGFLEAFEIITGMSCGLITRAEGQESSCNQIGGFPRPGVPMPQTVRKMNPDWDTYCKGQEKEGGAQTLPATLTESEVDELGINKPMPVPTDVAINKPGGGGNKPIVITDVGINKPWPADGGHKPKPMPGDGGHKPKPMPADGGHKPRPKPGNNVKPSPLPGDNVIKPSPLPGDNEIKQIPPIPKGGVKQEGTEETDYQEDIEPEEKPAKPMNSKPESNMRKMKASPRGKRQQQRRGG